MDKIILSNLAFYGYHGVLEEENKLGQKFFIDIELYCDLKKAGESDDLNFSVNYARVYDIAKDICENNRYKLIESLAENISKKIFQEFNIIDEVLIRIKKPEAPVKGIFDYFGVEIRRKKDA
ncbi:dihydroneopterin aldolase [Alkalithermobacter thermoalcaliphilus JW-YL-7 = DSM 7308]|uniref:7,8-dihydroneopterin aldolase n=1 Tax=Alkalithermobacter thermoalcaliphilus JW-YL-7 = DSM 7308 TaxID=1121328 RepID=A0A150FQ86_CLOPD|nr:dihydroneopterin aldolase [[Clostridium] paradoxum JW-YL-7 = DSM 7308]SHK62688.1 dihydroneopterin aldolase [[Clostridium] paradoxum JW-YL-7 = DSM 7308]